MVQDGEILFLVLSYLQEAVPSADTALGLLLDAASPLLPRRIEYNGEEHAYSLAELQAKYSHVPRDALKRLLQQLLTLRRSEGQPGGQGLSTLLGAGRLSLLAPFTSYGQAGLAPTDNVVNAPGALPSPQHQLIQRQRSMQGLQRRVSMNGVALSTRRSSSSNASLAGMPQHMLSALPGWMLPPHSSASPQQAVFLRQLHGKAAALPALKRPDRMMSCLRHARTFRGHRMVIYCVCYAGGGKYVMTGSDDWLVKIWSAHTGRLLVTCRGHQGEISDLYPNQDDTLLASASNDKDVRIWNLKDGFLGQPVAVLVGHTAPVNRLEWHPLINQIIMTCADDGTCRIWNATDDTVQPLVLEAGKAFAAHNQQANNTTPDHAAGTTQQQHNQENPRALPNSILEPARLASGAAAALIAEHATAATAGPAGNAHGGSSRGALPTNTSAQSPVRTTRSRAVGDGVGPGRLDHASTEQVGSPGGRRQQPLRGGRQQQTQTTVQAAVPPVPADHHNVDDSQEGSDAEDDEARNQEQLNVCMFTKDGEYIIAGGRLGKVYTWHWPGLPLPNSRKKHPTNAATASNQVGAAVAAGVHNGHDEMLLTSTGLSTIGGSTQAPTTAADAKTQPNVEAGQAGALKKTKIKMTKSKRGNGNAASAAADHSALPPSFPSALSAVQSQLAKGVLAELPSRASQAGDTQRHQQKTTIQTADADGSDSRGIHPLIKLEDLLHGHWPKAVQLHVMEGHTTDIITMMFDPGSYDFATLDRTGNIRIWQYKAPSSEADHHTWKANFMIDNLALSMPTAATGAGAHSASTTTTLQPNVGVANNSVGATTLGARPGLAGKKKAVAAEVPRIEDMDWSVDGALMLGSTSDKHVRVWNAKSGRCVHTFYNAHTDLAYLASCHPHDPRIACTGGHDGLVNVWDIQAGKLLKRFSTQDTMPLLGARWTDALHIMHGEWSPDGTSLAISDTAGQLHMYVLGCPSPAMLLWPYDQFFDRDYARCTHDIHHWVIDSERQVPPHLLPQQRLVNRVDEPYSEDVQLAVSTGCSSHLPPINMLELPNGLFAEPPTVTTALFSVLSHGGTMSSAQQAALRALERERQALQHYMLNLPIMAPNRRSSAGAGVAPATRASTPGSRQHHHHQQQPPTASETHRVNTANIAGVIGGAAGPGDATVVGNATGVAAGDGRRRRSPSPVSSSTSYDSALFDDDESSDEDYRISISSSGDDDDSGRGTDSDAVSLEKSDSGSQSEDDAGRGRKQASKNKEDKQGRKKGSKSRGRRDRDGAKSRRGKQKKSRKASDDEYDADAHRKNKRRGKDKRRGSKSAKDEKKKRKRDMSKKEKKEAERASKRRSKRSRFDDEDGTTTEEDQHMGDDMMLNSDMSDLEGRRGRSRAAKRCPVVKTEGKENQAVVVPSSRPRTTRNSIKQEHGSSDHDAAHAARAATGDGSTAPDPDATAAPQDAAEHHSGSDRDDENKIARPRRRNAKRTVFFDTSSSSHELELEHEHEHDKPLSRRNSQRQDGGGAEDDGGHDGSKKHRSQKKGHGRSSLPANSTTGRPLTCYGWLRSTQHSPARYVPQVGDEVMYLRHNHEMHLRSSCKAKAVAATPWQALHKAITDQLKALPVDQDQEGARQLLSSWEMRPAEPCKITAIQYSIDSKGDTLPRLVLQLLELPASLPCNPSFQVDMLHPHTKHTDFIVLKSRYLRAKARAWRAGDVCKVYRHDNDGSGHWWKAIIVQQNAKTDSNTPHQPALLPQPANRPPIPPGRAHAIRAARGVNEGNNSQHDSGDVSEGGEVPQRRGKRRAASRRVIRTSDSEGAVDGAGLQQSRLQRSGHGHDHLHHDNVTSRAFVHMQQDEHVQPVPVNGLQQDDHGTDAAAAAAAVAHHELRHRHQRGGGRSLGAPVRRSNRAHQPSVLLTGHITDEHVLKDVAHLHETSLPTRRSAQHAQHAPHHVDSTDTAPSERHEVACDGLQAADPHTVAVMPDTARVDADFKHPADVPRLQQQQQEYLQCQENRRLSISTSMDIQINPGPVPVDMVPVNLLHTQCVSTRHTTLQQHDSATLVAQEASVKVSDAALKIGQGHDVVMTTAMPQHHDQQQQEVAELSPELQAVLAALKETAPPQNYATAPTEPLAGTTDVQASHSGDHGTGAVGTDTHAARDVEVCSYGIRWLHLLDDSETNEEVGVEDDVAQGGVDDWVCPWNLLPLHESWEALVAQEVGLTSDQAATAQAAVEYVMPDGHAYEDEYEIFMNAPDPDTVYASQHAAGGEDVAYNTVVALPLALVDIQDRLANNYYRSMDAVRRDLQLIVENCSSFNGPDTDLTENADRLCNFIMSQLQSSHDDEEEEY